MNQDFYIQNTHRKVIDSNPDLKDQTDYFVWDPHTCWEYNYGLLTGHDMFPNAEIYRGIRPPDAREFNIASDRRVKVALLFHELVYQKGKDLSNTDLIKNIGLQWADLVITYTTEFMPNWWPIVYGNICRQTHTDRIICLFDGKPNYTNPPADRVFTNMRSFFSMVAAANHYQEINQINTPFRKYMFDMLIGTAKTARIYLMYRLLDHNLTDRVLLNLQPNPHGFSWDYIQRIDPAGWSKYGMLDDYTSPSLLGLEETVIQEFKHRTQHGSARDRYSVNLVPRPGHNLPGDNTPSSVIVPWHVYQASWYSVVCETTDIGNSNDFLTEKTAKCLFGKRIFVMMNGAGLLKSLRRMGFKTFHGDIIDESYDDEPDDAKRFSMAWEQIYRLYHTEPRQVYAHFQDILEHNHNLLCSFPANQLQEIQQFINQSLRQSKK